MGFLDWFKPKTPTVQTILPDAAVQEIMKGRLPILNTNKIFLKGGETCHYIDKAIYEKKTVRKRYVRRNHGTSYGGIIFKDVRHHYGGGTTDVAVISLGDAVASTSVPKAGDHFDEAIANYMRKKYNLLIGERTAEDVKINIGTAFKRDEVDYMDVRGRNLVTGLPETVKVSSDETYEALKETTAQILDAICKVLEETPPELAADIMDRGIVLTGGGAMLRGLEELIEERTHINTMTADDPMTCVAIGTGKYIELLADYKDEL